MTKKNETALAPVDSFAIANRYEGMDPELLDELKDQLDDLDDDGSIDCRTIKIPAGGGTSFEVQNGNGDDTDPAKTIDAVIIFTHRLNGYWPESFGGGDGEDKIPACSSMDGKTGVCRETGEVRSCENCPFNQFGTATDSRGDKGRGKACKNMRRLYLMKDGDPNFYLLSIPPTSIKDVNKQLKKIISAGNPYTSLIVTLRLEKTANQGGVAYSKVVIEQKGLLPPEAAAKALTMRRQIKEQYKDMAITLDDYASAPTQEAAVHQQTPPPDAAPEAPEFVEAVPMSDSDLPL